MFPVLYLMHLFQEKNNVLKDETPGSYLWKFITNNDWQIEVSDKHHTSYKLSLGINLRSQFVKGTLTINYNHQSVLSQSCRGEMFKIVNSQNLIMLVVFSHTTCRSVEINR